MFRATSAVLAGALLAPGASGYDHYRVDFNGMSNYVHVHTCQGVDARCGYESNNFASYSLDAVDGSSSVNVVVTSLHWTPSLGDDINIRPSYLVETGVVSNIEVVNTTDSSKSISFTVDEPCQISIEIGDEDSLFPDEDSQYDFANLMLFINPPVSEWPRQPPTATTGGCKSSDTGRSCVVATADDSCDPLVVPGTQDYWFQGNGDPSGAPKEYLFGDGCGDSPKQIVVQQGGRVFIDQDAVFYGRVVTDPGTGAAEMPVADQPPKTLLRPPRSRTAAQCDPSAYRNDCGLPVGKNQQSCEAGGCCWSPVNPNPSNLPWCFHQSSPSPAPSSPATGPAPAQAPAPAPAPAPVDTPSGLYGYGVISNVYMKGHKLGDKVSNVVDLNQDKAEVWGVTVLDSTYRNIQLGAGGRLDWTKSFAWNSETDCINMRGPGGRISNNFFKSNDDCMKAYQARRAAPAKGDTHLLVLTTALTCVCRVLHCSRTTAFMSTTSYVTFLISPTFLHLEMLCVHKLIECSFEQVWHQDTGRALMFSWGNLGEAEDTDGSVQFINTTIIHDKLGFRQANQLYPSPANEALGWQAGMIYYSSLINAEHSPSNHIGTPESPVYIQNLRLESRVGSLMLLSNGYAALDNKAGWMGVNGCTGNIHMHIDGLDMLKVCVTFARTLMGVVRFRDQLVIACVCRFDRLQPRMLRVVVIWTQHLVV